MANKIILKKSSVQGRVPNSGDLEIGEIAVNLSDGLLYSKNSTNHVIVVGSSTTSNVVEGSNLYFNNARAISAFTSGENIGIDANGLITASVAGAGTTVYDNVYFYIGDIKTDKFVGDDATTQFEIPIVPSSANSLIIFVNSIIQSPDTNYTLTDNVITFTSAPEQDAEILIKYIDNSDLGLTTENVTESTNLYFTNTRSISAFTAGKDIHIDANGLITSTSTGGVSSVNGEVGDVVLVTANITEDTNLYYTDQRVYSNVIQIGYSTQTDLGVVFDQSNTNSTLIGISYNQANTATTYATSAFDASNTTATLVGIVYAQSNTKANVVDLTTANVAEDTNLYYTDARVYSNVSQIGYATTGHVSSEIANLISSAPSTLDTLNELAAALGDDPNFATTTATLIGNAYNQGNAAYAQANIATTDARSAFDSGNSTITLVGVAYDQANTATTYATSAFNAGNTTATLVGVVYAQSNAKANVADLTTANVAEVTNLYYTNARVDVRVSPLFNQSNTNATLIGITYDQANTATTYATSAFNASNTNTTLIGIVFDQANTATTYATSAFGQANLAYNQANTATTYATSAFDAANTKTIAADLTTANVTEDTNLYYTDARVYANVQQIGFATTGYVNSEVANLVSSAPSTLDTLNELAAALGDDPNFATTTATLIGNAYNQGNAAYAQANIATTDARSAFAAGNTTITLVGVVYDQSNTKANVADLTTANVAEDTNLYFTNSRAISAFTAGGNIIIDANGLITANIIGGGGGTGAVSSVNGEIGDVVLVTANITEDTNLYFTNARAIASLTAGQNIVIDANGLITSTATGGGGESGTGTLDRYEFISTSNQSEFTGTDDNSNTLALTPLLTEVYLNGVRLVPYVDYTANATHIILTEPAAEGDQLSAVEFNAGGGTATEMIHPFLLAGM